MTRSLKPSWSQLNFPGFIPKTRGTHLIVEHTNIPGKSVELHGVWVPHFLTSSVEEIIIKGVHSRICTQNVDPGGNQSRWSISALHFTLVFLISAGLASGIRVRPSQSPTLDVICRTRILRSSLAHSCRGLPEGKFSAKVHSPHQNRPHSRSRRCTLIST